MICTITLTTGASDGGLSDIEMDSNCNMTYEPGDAVMVHLRTEEGRNSLVGDEWTLRILFTVITIQHQVRCAHQQLGICNGNAPLDISRTFNLTGYLNFLLIIQF